MNMYPLPPLMPRFPRALMASMFHGLADDLAPPRDPAEWAESTDEIIRHRLAPLALLACSDGAVALDVEVERRFRESWRRATTRALALEAMYPQVGQILDDAGVPGVFTKGFGLGLVYPQPATRLFGDIDVVVPRERFRDALTAFRRQGFILSDGAPPRDSFYVRCREATTLYRDGVYVDLHHQVPPWNFSRRLTFSDLWAESLEVRVGGGTVRVPSHRHHFVVALLHIFSHLGRPGEEPLVWRDVLVLAQLIGPDVLIRTVRELDVEGLARYVFDALPENLRPRATDSLGATMSPGQRHRLRKLLPPNIGARHLIGMVYRLPARNVPLFLGGYAFPSREFLRRHAGDAPFALLRWWREGINGVRTARRVHTRRRRIVADPSSPAEVA